MNGDRIAMSARERDRLKVMAPVVEGQRTVEFGGHVTYLPCRTWPGRPVRARTGPCLGVLLVWPPTYPPAAARSTPFGIRPAKAPPAARA